MGNQYSRSFSSGHCLFSGCDIPEHIEEAKKYIKRNGLSNDDVRLVKDKQGGISVYAKRNIRIKV